MSAKVDMGLKVFFLVFPMIFDSFCLDLFGCFGFFGFPDGLVFSNVHLIPLKGSDVDALLC